MSIIQWKDQFKFESIVSNHLIYADKWNSKLCTNRNSLDFLAYVRKLVHLKCICSEIEAVFFETLIDFRKYCIISGIQSKNLEKSPYYCFHTKQSVLTFYVCCCCCRSCYFPSQFFYIHKDKYKTKNRTCVCVCECECVLSEWTKIDVRE